MDKKELKQILYTAMGDDDLKFYAPKGKIIRYDELQRYNNIDELLKMDLDYCIILYNVNTPNSGHWIGLLKYPENNTLEYFDPYGKIVDEPLKWVSEEQLKQSGILKPYLGDLLNKSNRNIIYNPIAYQSKKEGISTCGRHTIFRIINLIKYNKTLTQYYNLMKKLKKDLNCNYDDIVSFFISRI